MQEGRERKKLRSIQVCFFKIRCPPIISPILLICSHFLMPGLLIEDSWISEGASGRFQMMLRIGNFVLRVFSSREKPWERGWFLQHVILLLNFRFFISMKI